jgi:serine/threonine-protein kinase
MKQQILSEGTVIGDRFEVMALAGKGDLGTVYKARSIKDEKIVALRIIPKEMIVNTDEMEALRSRVREASGLAHRNIRNTLGMGSAMEEGVYYIAIEWIDGQNLRTLLTKRGEAEKRFSFKGAYNIIGHVCNALAVAHPETCHGAIGPLTIMINNAGRVKIGDWGLSKFRVDVHKRSAEGTLESTFWAPETLSENRTPDFQADIYSLGALFYELITGVPPQRPLKAPSLLGFPKEVDAVIARCMAADPTQRYPDVGAVKAAIKELVEKQQVESEEKALQEQQIDDDLGIDIEVDMSDMEAPAGPAPEEDRASKGGSMLDAPGLPPPPTGRQDTGRDGSRASLSQRASTVDMGAVLDGLEKSESAHWMVQKDKFDHGPFTDRELIQMILLGEVTGKHLLLNMDDGVRKKVRAWGDFETYLERYRIKKQEEAERLALEKTEKAETRGSAFKWLLAVSVLGVIGLAVGGYFLTRTLRKEKTFSPAEMLAALDSGEFKLKTGGNLIDKKRRRRKGGRRGSKGGGKGGGGGGGMSYEDAMNMGVNLGGLSGGGEQQLTPAQIMRIMDKNVRRFLPCMGGQPVKRVDMDLAIAGDGRLIGVSVKQGDSKLKKCVASKVRSIKFPSSSAPRTAASWYFEIY